MIDLAVIIGLVAGIFTTFANLPQFIRSWKTKSTKDLSLAWIIILALGVFLWFIYGVMINSIPVMVANFFTEILIFGILYLKLKYK